MFSIILKQEWISKEYQNKVMQLLIVVNFNTLLHESECEFTKLPYGHNQGTKKTFIIVRNKDYSFHSKLYTT